MVSDEVRALMLKEASSNAIREVAVNSGSMITLRDAGLLRVKEGITSIEELLMVTSGE